MGQATLGYNHTKDLGLVINIEGSRIVILIFNKYIELASYKKVTEYINSLGYKSKVFNSGIGGKKFVDTSIANILKNPIYIGQIKYKDNVYPGKHQPIIDKEIFNRAQEIIKRNDQRNVCIRKVNKHNFLLEGLIRCGECQAVMAPKWSLAHGRRYFYYECTTAGHGGKNACNTKALSAPALESLVLRIIRKIRKDDTLLNQIINGNTANLQKEILQLEAERIILNIKNTELTKKATSIVDRLLSITELSHSQILYDEVGRLEQEKAGITKQIEDLDFKITQLKNRTINIDLARQSLQYFSQVYLGLDPNGKKGLMQLLVKEVSFNNQQISINLFNYIDTSSTNTSVAPAGLVGGAYRLVAFRKHETNLQSTLQYKNLPSL